MLFTQFIKRYKKMLKTKQRGWKELGSRDILILILIALLLVLSIALVSFTLLNSFSKNHQYNWWVIGTGISSVVLSFICGIIININKTKNDVIQKTYQKRVEAIEDAYLQDYRDLDYKGFLLWVRKESNQKIINQNAILEKARFGYVIGFMAPVLNLIFPNGMKSVVVLLSALLLLAIIAVFRIQAMDHYELYRELNDVISYYLISDYKMMNIYSISVNGESSVCTVKQVQDE